MLSYKGRMTEEKIQWISREKHKQVVLVTLLCLSSALIAFAPRNERRLFTVPQLPAGLQTIAAPEETDARTAIFGAIDDQGIGARFGERTTHGFFARTPGGSDSVLNMPGAARRLAAVSSPRAFAASPVSAVLQDATAPSALFAQPLDDGGVAASSTPAATSTPSSSSGGGSSGGPAGAQPLALVPPSAATPNQPAQQDPGAVPEPATWLMLLGGFGLVGAFMRRQPARLAERVL
jgi:hypothetical protein